MIHSLQPAKTGFLRLPQIIGTAAACTGKKHTPKEHYQPLIPISRASWWSGVKSGKYPQPIKLDQRTTVWKTEDIYAFIEAQGKEAA